MTTMSQISPAVSLLFFLKGRVQFNFLIFHINRMHKISKTQNLFMARYCNTVSLCVPYLLIQHAIRMLYAFLIVYLQH